MYPLTLSKLETLIILFSLSVRGGFVDPIPSPRPHQWTHDDCFQTEQKTVPMICAEPYLASQSLSACVESPILRLAFPVCWLPFCAVPKFIQDPLQLPEIPNRIISDSCLILTRLRSVERFVQVTQDCGSLRRFWGEDTRKSWEIHPNIWLKVLQKSPKIPPS